MAITVPGFEFAGISAGLKKSGDSDLALIVSDRPATIAGVFTTNNVKAAPVKLAIENIGSRKGRAIIINSGNANACTGLQGFNDAKEIIRETAGALGVTPGLVYVSSTGIIGKRLPKDKIINSLPELVKTLSPDGLSRVADAIMTTDTFAKSFAKKIRISSKTGTIAAIAKGAGMIRPNMATMLCFIVTDISLTPAALDSALKEAVDASFNMLSVDNDMSTNDTVMVMANGALGNKPVGKNSPDFPKFKKILNEITYALARMIAEDGEGATKYIEVAVKGARTEADARNAAKAVAGSMLVKTAIYGKDPNWGRIMSAIGYSGAAITENKTGIFINNIKLVHKGQGTGKENVIQKILANNAIVVTIDLGMGSKTAKALTCDLTEGYIEINADYSS